MTDLTPWAVDLSFADLDTAGGFKGVLGGLFGGGKTVGDGAEGGAEGGGVESAFAGEMFKEASLYGANTPMPFKKTLSITRTNDFEVGWLAALVHYLVFL